MMSVKVMPIALRGYQRSWLRADILAGLTLAAVAIPECMGYSSIAQVPVVIGLYTIIIPTLLFALVGASRLLVVGADSATAAVLASGIAGIGVAGLMPGTDQWAHWAALIALVTGGLLFAAWALRLGFLADFLSTAVLVGFLTGVGISVFIGQIPGCLGIKKSDGQIWQVIADIVRGIPHLSWWSLGFAVAAVGLILANRRWMPRFPGAIVVVVASIALVAVVPLKHVPTVGTVHGGLPSFGLPSGLTWLDVPKAATVAIGCAIVILAQSAATARSFAQKHGDTPDVNRDILGLSAANVGAGFTGTFVVNGSPTKTQLLDGQQGRTQVANITLAIATLVVVVFLDGLLADLPHAVLSAIVALIAIDLVDLKAWRHIWKIRRIEFAIAALTALVVLVFGVQTGLITAMGVSILEIIRRLYRPQRFVIAVGKKGETSYETARNGEQSLPGLLVFRYDADLFYANASRFSDDVTGLMKAAPDPVRWLVLDCTSIADVDYSASTMLTNLIAYVHSNNAHFVLAGVDPELQDTLLTEGLLADVNPDHVFGSVAEAVAAFEKL